MSVKNNDEHKIISVILRLKYGLVDEATSK